MIAADAIDNVLAQEQRRQMGGTVLDNEIEKVCVEREKYERGHSDAEAVPGRGLTLRVGLGVKL
jgi:hypothetical protein